MARHQKELTKKQQIIMCVIAAATAIVIALGMCFLLVASITKPEEFVVNDVQRKPLSEFENITTPDFVYVPEASLIVTDAGAKESMDKIVTTANNVKPSDVNKVIVKNYSVDTSKLVKRKVKISVDYLAQKPELPSGSEITALTTILNFYGYNVSKTEMSEKYLDKTIDKLGDFKETYVGDPTKKGFGCFAKPIVTAANRYLESNDKAYVAVDHSGKKFEDLLKLVESNTPVIIWGTTYNDKTKTLQEPYSSIQWNINDKAYTWISPQHCMVLIGYDLNSNTAIVSDPLRGIVEYDLDTVKARYLALGSQCVAFERKPIITGVENGAIYYTTQCVSILNHDFSSVTLNGIDVEDVFLIPGNKKETYRITITEADGNTIEYVIYTKPIISLFDTLQDVNEFTVTNEHRDTINEIKNSLSAANTEYSSSEENKTIEESIAICDLMLNNIDSANSEFDRISKIMDTYKETKPTNESEVSKLLESILSLSSNQNLTSQQKSALNEMQTTCHQYLLEIRPIE